MTAIDAKQICLTVYPTSRGSFPNKLQEESNRLK